MTWQYIAGFFDGEGTFGVSGGRTPAAAIFASMAQKKRPVLEEIRIFLTACGIRTNLNGPFPSRNSTDLVIRAKTLPLFLQGILPFLIVKKLIAQDALRLNKLYPRTKKLWTYSGQPRNASGQYCRSK